VRRYEEVRDRIGNRPRTWLVTGAAGFIGSHLVEALLKLDQAVIGVDNFSTGYRSNLAQVKDAVTARHWRKFNFIEGDIRSLDSCRQACRSVNVVLHHAALGSVPVSIEDPIRANESNVTGFLNMLVAAHGAGVSRFVYAGSSAIYGDHPLHPNVESQIGRPLSPYAVTKYVNELYAEIFARCYGFESVGLRYFNVFGPRQDPGGAYAAVIPTWICSMIRNEPVQINGDGETTRDFCYIDNVVQANLLAATVDDSAAINETYNIALSEGTSLNELFKILRSLLESRYRHVRSLQPAYREFRHGDVRLSKADIHKARRLLGYEPLWGVRQGLARSIDWYVAKLAPSHSIEQMPEPRPARHGS
jgi:UDP-N-acetylglucosamine 4-epimerase